MGELRQVLVDKYMQVATNLNGEGVLQACDVDVMAAYAPSLFPQP